jgi:hypothetical protein
MSETQDRIEAIFGGCISCYTRAQAIDDGVLVDVSKTASEAGFKWSVAITRAVYDRYVEVPEELSGQQDIQGRLWDVLWMFWVNVRTGKIDGDRGEFTLLVRFPAAAEWQSNEKAHPAEMGGLRLVTLKSVSGPGDNGEPCITIMLPDED